MSAASAKKARKRGKAKFVFLFLLIVIIGACIFCKMPGEKVTAKLQPFYEQPIAHRGYFDNDSTAPENSLAAFQRAIDNGYAIELDTQISADGTVWVLHDKSLLRSSGIDKNIDAMTDAEIRECTLFGTSEKVPTFAEVLELIDGKTPLLVEIKGEAGDDVKAISKATAELLDNYKGVYVVQSFNPFAVQWFRENRPDVPRGQLVQDFIAHGEGQNPAIRFALTAQLTNVLSRPNFIAYQLKDSGQITFQALKNLTGIDCFAWTLKSQAELDSAKAQGFKGLIFDSFEAKL